jgi:hypothetical protein
LQFMHRLSVCNHRIAGLFLVAMSTALFSATIIAQIASADNLNVDVGDGGQGFGCGTQSTTVDSGSATESCTLSGAAVGSSLTGTLTATGNLATGTLGTFADITLSSPNGATLPVNAESGLLYDFGSSASGTSAVFTLRADGTLSGLSPAQLISVNNIGEYINGQPGVTSLLLGSGTTVFTITAPFVSSNSVFFDVESDAQVSCSTVLSAPCTSTSDFLHTVTITGAQVFDGNGNLVSGATLLSQSGYNPNGQPVATPEPGGLALAGLPMLVVLGLFRKNIR